MWLSFPNVEMHAQKQVFLIRKGFSHASLHLLSLSCFSPPSLPLFLVSFLVLRYLRCWGFLPKIPRVHSRARHPRGTFDRSSPIVCCSLSYLIISYLGMDFWDERRQLLRYSLSNILPGCTSVVLVVTACNFEWTEHNCYFDYVPPVVK